MNTDKQTVFISYCHNNNNDHLQWVLNLAQRISAYDVRVTLDQQGLGAGDNKYHFMDPLIREAGKVAIIFTPEYKFKAENRIGGVGYEYALITEDLYRTMLSNKKYIPVLRSGTIESSIPVFMRQFIAVDLRDQSRFETGLQELMAAILDRPPAGGAASGAGSFRGMEPLSGHLSGRTPEGRKPDDPQSFLAELGMIGPLIGIGKDVLSDMMEAGRQHGPAGHETADHDPAGHDPSGFHDDYQDDHHDDHHDPAADSDFQHHPPTDTG